jgi:hypothetical protein
MNAPLRIRFDYISGKWVDEAGEGITIGGDSFEARWGDRDIVVNMTTVTEKYTSSIPEYFDRTTKQAIGSIQGGYIVFQRYCAAVPGQSDAEVVELPISDLERFRRLYDSVGQPYTAVVKGVPCMDDDLDLSEDIFHFIPYPEKHTALFFRVENSGYPERSTDGSAAGNLGFTAAHFFDETGKYLGIGIWE